MTMSELSAVCECQGDSQSQIVFLQVDQSKASTGKTARPFNLHDLHASEKKRESHEIAIYEAILIHVFERRCHISALKLK